MTAQTSIKMHISSTSLALLVSVAKNAGASPLKCNQEYGQKMQITTLLARKYLFAIQDKGAPPNILQHEAAPLSIICQCQASLLPRNLASISPAREIYIHLQCKTLP